MVAFVKLFTLAVSLCKCSLLLLLGPHFIAGLLPVNVQSSLRNLNKLRSNVATYEKSTVEIEYTSMSSKDVPKLARMISANFDGPYSWWQKPLEVYSVWTLECQLSDRYEKFMVQKERDHLMLVARVEGAAVGKKFLLLLQLDAWSEIHATTIAVLSILTTQIKTQIQIQKKTY